MPTTSLVVSGLKSGLLGGNVSIGPLIITNGSSGDQVQSIALSGNTTITVPGAGYVGVLIIPPSTNTSGITLKGVSGDSGAPLHPSNASVYSFPAGTGSFVLNGSATVELIWF